MAVEGSMEAEIIKSKLESYRYSRCSCNTNRPADIFGITMNGLGKVKIMVPEDLLEEARKMLAE